MTKGNFKLRRSLSSLRICRSKKSSSSTPVARNPNKSLEIIAYPKLPPPPPSTPDHPLSKPGLCRVLPVGSSGSGCECGSYKFIISTAHVTSASNLDSSPANKMVENYDGFHEKLCNSQAEAEAEAEAACSSEDIHDLDHEESLILWPIDHPLEAETNISRDRNREIGFHAVMKKSTDPYKDFKKSITEMIVEKEIFELEELQKLLMCFLSLNATQHRVAIVEAFTQVWEELFC